MSQTIRVRFAPSPTGALHIGSARTALFNWLFARHVGGTFVLRIEDTDATRSTDESTRSILEGLEWLGLDWDEGPGVGGDYGPYYQSQRLHLYHQFAERLQARGMAYPCFCTQEELDTRRKLLLEQGKPPKYDRKCYHLSEDERRARIEAGQPHVLRFYSEDEGETVFEDVIRGEVRFANHVLDDFVIIRSDRQPTYNFAVVVDDHLMAITHVIRGEDHISNTPRQVQVYEALGLEIPVFAHLPMILGPDRSKLSKRHGARSVMEYAADGYLPEAVFNYISLLGWAYDDSQELFDVPDELVEKFTLEKISKNPAIFDVQKLEWMNGVYIRELPDHELAKRALPLMVQAGLLDEAMSPEVREKYIATVRAVQSRIRTINEIVDATRYFFSDDITYDEAAVKKFLHRDYVPKLFQQLLDELSDLDPFTEETIEQAFDRLGQRFELKKADLMQPVRVALTGGSASPGMYETVALIGRQKSCDRLRTWIESFKRDQGAVV